jgi:hypothetical protein
MESEVYLFFMPTVNFEAGVGAPKSKGAGNTTQPLIDA